MKISEIIPYVLNEDLEKEFFFSQWEYSNRKICIVKIICDNGIVGWGEAYGPAPVVKESVNYIKQNIIGMNPLESDVIWSTLFRRVHDYGRSGVFVSAISAIDIALWDIKGKYHKLPVSTLLGGSLREKIRPYATGLYFSDSKTLTDDLCNEALEYVNEGFKSIKMKVGLSIKDDVTNVKAVRNTIGPDIELMIDSNHAYSYDEALKLSKKLEDQDIKWFEEPLSPEFYNQYSDFKSKSLIPVAAGECEYLRYGFQKLLDKNCIDFLQMDICSCGGLTEAKRISALSSTKGVKVIPHTWGSGIAFYTAINFISNLEPIPGRLYNEDAYIEYDRTENKIRENIIKNNIIMKDGYISVNDNPGLGINVDETYLNEIKI
jgi:D-galactarolactone cycloisomerase